MKKILILIGTTLILSACTMQTFNQVETSTSVAKTQDQTQTVLTGTIDQEIDKELSNLEAELKKLDEADFGDNDLIGLE